MYEKNQVSEVELWFCFFKQEVTKAIYHLPFLTVLLLLCIILSYNFTHDNLHVQCNTPQFIYPRRRVQIIVKTSSLVKDLLFILMSVNYYISLVKPTRCTKRYCCLLADSSICLTNACCCPKHVMAFQYKINLIHWCIPSSFYYSNPKMFSPIDLASHKKFKNQICNLY